jgi:hypothetical protein
VLAQALEKEEEAEGSSSSSYASSSVDHPRVRVVKGQELHLSLPDVLQPSWDKLLVPILPFWQLIIRSVVLLKFRVLLMENHRRRHGSNQE